MTEEVYTKICNRCKKEKNVDEFSASSFTPDKKQYQCKQCKYEYYLIAKEKKGYSALIPEGMKTCRACGKEKPFSEYYRRSTKNGFESECKECCNLRNIDWSRKNKLSRKEHRKKWESKNPLNRQQRNSTRRARRKRLTVGKIDFSMILQRDNGHCYLCGKPIDPRDLHFDHVVPLSKGGEHSNDNLRPSHALCNMKKGDKLLSDLIGKSLILG